MKSDLAGNNGSRSRACGYDVPIKRVEEALGHVWWTPNSGRRHIVVTTALLCMIMSFITHILRAPQYSRARSC